METIQTHPLPQYRIAKTVVLGDLTIARRAREVLLDNCELEPIVVFSHEKTPISWCPTYWGQFIFSRLFLYHLFQGAYLIAATAALDFDFAGLAAAAIALAVADSRKSDMTESRLSSKC